MVAKHKIGIESCETVERSSNFCINACGGLATPDTIVHSRGAKLAKFYYSVASEVSDGR